MEGPMHGVNSQSVSIGISWSRLMSIAMMDLGLVRKLKACPAGFWGFDEAILARKREHRYSSQSDIKPGMPRCLHGPARQSVAKKAGQRLMGMAHRSPRLSSGVKGVESFGVVIRRLCHGCSQTTPRQGRVSRRAACQLEKGREEAVSRTERTKNNN